MSEEEEEENTNKHTEGSLKVAHRPEQTTNGALPPGTYNVTFDANGTATWTPIIPWQSYYQQQPTVTYTVPALTEERVRAIFREELRAWERDLAKLLRVQSQHDWAMASQKGNTRAGSAE